MTNTARKSLFDGYCQLFINTYTAGVASPWDDGGSDGNVLTTARFTELESLEQHADGIKIATESTSTEVTVAGGQGANEKLLESGIVTVSTAIRKVSPLEFFTYFSGYTSYTAGAVAGTNPNTADILGQLNINEFELLVVGTNADGEESALWVVRCSGADGFDIDVKTGDFYIPSEFKSMPPSLALNSPAAQARYWEHTTA